MLSRVFNAFRRRKESLRKNRNEDRYSEQVVDEKEIEDFGLRIEVTVSGSSSPAEQYEEIYRNLVSDVLIQTGDPLTVFERLWIVHNSGIMGELNRRWLCDLYEKAGCYAAAVQVYMESRHWRKMGDAAFASGDLPLAQSYYEKPGDSKGEVFRSGPDWDRLIVLAFISGRWEDVPKLIAQANVTPVDDRQVVVGSGTRAKRPLAKMTAIALVKAGPQGSRPSDTVRTCLGIDQEEWASTIEAYENINEKTIVSEQEKANPFRRRPPEISLKEALERGAAPDAAAVLEAAKRFADDYPRLKNTFLRYLAHGASTDRDTVIKAIVALRDPTLIASALFYIDGKGYEVEQHGSGKRALTFYEAHPLLYRNRFGHCVSIKAKHGIPLTGSDLLTGVFQALAWPTREVKAMLNKKREDEINIPKLQSSAEWAEIRLEDWQTREGASVIEAAVQKLADGVVRDIRRELPWLDAMETTIKWLSACWREEIGVSPWVSENKLFQLIKKRFRGHDVRQHDIPLWIEPQHLDVYVADLRLAIEYQGEQHYRPVEVFGGGEAFFRTQERDRRKAENCRRVGVALEYVRYDEHIETRVEEIATRYLAQ